MRRVGYLIEQIADTDNLRLALWKAKRSKEGKRDVQTFLNDWEGRLLQMRKDILSNRVKVGNYHYFKIYDPKERTICAASFAERVLHHAIMNVCHPYFERHLIYDTYATRLNKGTYAALERAFEYAHKYKYVVKLDYRKYFDSISHEKLKLKLRRLFKDASLLTLLDNIVDSYSVKEGYGIPIGNLTSQYFANYYLSHIDHFCKENLSAKGYVRYMDDILIFANEKEYLHKMLKKVQAESESEELHLKNYSVHRVSDGVKFLGYKIYPHTIRLSKESQRRFKTKINMCNQCLKQGKWSQETYRNHIIPLLSFTMHANTMKWRKTLGL